MDPAEIAVEFARLFTDVQIELMKSIQTNLFFLVTVPLIVIVILLMKLTDKKRKSDVRR